MGLPTVMKLNDALQNIDFLGLDTSPFIYFVKQNALYVDLMREIFRRVTNNNFQSCSSVITLTEVLVQPLRQNNKALAENYRELLFHGANFQLFPLTAAIAERAAEIRARYNLRTPDALQIATALENNCDAFLCDDEDLKRVTELQILILDDLEF